MLPIRSLSTILRSNRTRITSAAENNSGIDLSDRLLKRVQYSLAPGFHTVVFTAYEPKLWSNLLPHSEQWLSFPAEAGKHYGLVSSRWGNDIYCAIIEEDTDRLISGGLRKGWWLFNRRCYQRSCNRTGCSPLYECPNTCLTGPVNLATSVELEQKCTKVEE